VPAPASSTERQRPLRVVITRPRERAQELAARLEAYGDTVLIEPLLAIERIPEATPDLAGVQAVVLTSANAAPALSGPAKGLPVFAVGDATAAAARRAGCATVVSADGAGADLARLIARRCRPDGGVLLHLSGEEVRPGMAEALAAAGFVLRRQPVYQAEAASTLSPSATEAFRRGQIDAVLLFSPRTARILVDLVRKHELDASVEAVSAVCLSAAVAKPCRELVWRDIYFAERPGRAALLEALEAVRRRC
jgi:uroporphyrinogen-III synthase